MRLTYGSSGNFFRQIQQGAPFELFLSADEEYVRRLAQEGLTVDGGARYATGRIVLFVPQGSTVKADPAFADLARRDSDDGRLRRLAIANPEHAPYGRAARQALEHAGLWDALCVTAGPGRERLAGRAVRALGFGAGGNFRAVARVVAGDFAGKGDYVLIPENWHEPLHQRAVLLRRAGARRLRSIGSCSSPDAREVFRRYGFVLPGD